jgi:alkylhydroperoxidase family enzyme
MSEDEIAALDSDWASFPPAEQAALALARRLTFEPHKLSDADIDRCREHYTDLQILEMVLSVCGNNSTNRWKEGIGVPQSQGGGGLGRRRDATQDAAQVPDEKHSYVTPTSEKFLKVVTRVAPVVPKDRTAELSNETLSVRPPLESAEEVEARLAECRTRRPRLPVLDEAQAREVFGEAAPEGPLPQWMRLMANFPVSGKQRAASFLRFEEEADLRPLLRARISWVIARQDRAWYALGESKRRLIALGQSEEDIAALDGDWKDLPPADRALLTIAKHLSASPMVLVRDEVTRAVELAGPRDVVQTITYVGNRAFFDRVTEAAALPLEP